MQLDLSLNVVDWYWWRCGLKQCKALAPSHPYGVPRMRQDVLRVQTSDDVVQLLFARP
jgi:hypothetical protein